MKLPHNSSQPPPPPHPPPPSNLPPNPTQQRGSGNDSCVYGQCCSTTRELAYISFDCMTNGPEDSISYNIIMKTCIYNVDPLKPHFHTVKLGFTGVYIIFLFLLKNIDCGYSLEPPRRDGSNEYPQSMFWADIRKISELFVSENFQFLEVKISIYFNRRVFVLMCVCAQQRLKSACAGLSESSLSA